MGDCFVDKQRDLLVTLQINFLEMLNELEKKAVELTGEVHSLYQTLDEYTALKDKIINKLQEIDIDSNDTNEFYTTKLKAIEQRLDDIELKVGYLKKTVNTYKEFITKIARESPDMQHYKDTLNTIWDETATATLQNNILQIVINDIPPRTKISNYSKANEKFRTAIREALNKLQDIPHFEKAHVLIQIHHPNRREKTDVDNRAIKIILDTLRIKGIVPDDSYKYLSVTVIGHHDYQLKTVVTVIPLNSADDIIKRLLPVTD